MKPSIKIFILAACGCLVVAVLAYMFMSHRVAFRGHAFAAIGDAVLADASDDGNSSAASTTVMAVNTPFSTTTYKYKIAQSVDPCTLNTLGKQGWKLVNFVTNNDSVNATAITTVGGKDEQCQRQGKYTGFFAVVLELATSTTDNTLTIDTAFSSQYKLLQNPDLCLFNTLGDQGWRAVQFGTTISTQGGYDETCKLKGEFTTFDWVLFQRPVQ